MGVDTEPVANNTNQSEVKPAKPVSDKVLKSRLKNLKIEIEKLDHAQDIERIDAFAEHVDRL